MGRGRLKEAASRREVVGGGRGGGAWAGPWRLLGAPWLLHPRGASGEMAARSLGSGVGRLLRGLHGHSGQSGWLLSLSRWTTTRFLGSVPAAAQLGSYPALSAQAAQEPAAFWGPLARDTLVWDTPYHTVWDCDFRTGKIGWFLGGQLNVSGECVAGTSSVSRRLRRPQSVAAAPRPWPFSPECFTTHSNPCATSLCSVSHRVQRVQLAKQQLRAQICSAVSSGKLRILGLTSEWSTLTQILGGLCLQILVLRIPSMVGTKLTNQIGRGGESTGFSAQGTAD